MKSREITKELEGVQDIKINGSSIKIDIRDMPSLIDDLHCDLIKPFKNKKSQYIASLVTDYNAVLDLQNELRTNTLLLREKIRSQFNKMQTLGAAFDQAVHEAKLDTDVIYREDVKSAYRETNYYILAKQLIAFSKKLNDIENKLLPSYICDGAGTCEEESQFRDPFRKKENATSVPIKHILPGYELQQTLSLSQFSFFNKPVELKRLAGSFFLSLQPILNADTEAAFAKGSYKSQNESTLVVDHVLVGVLASLSLLTIAALLYLVWVNCDAKHKHNLRFDEEYGFDNDHAAILRP